MREVHHTRKKSKDATTSAEHTTEPCKVPVVYYLSRNGNLEHPHFIEVPLSSSDGLYLRDVIDRLNSLRGKGMAASYSWSSKRSYKNRFVWQDLSENDFIYPAHGQDYILKGSETSFLQKDTNTKNQSCSSIKYKVYDRRERIEEEEKEEVEEISPPPSDSSPETLESVMKADGLIILRPGMIKDRKPKVNPADGNNKVKARSNVLMQLITCGSISSREFGPGGLPMISHYKSKMAPRGGEVDDGVVLRKGKKQMMMEDKEYFSGSLVESKKEKHSAIKRSKSYAGNR